MSMRKHNQTTIFNKQTFRSEGFLPYAKYPLLFLCLLTLAVSASAAHTPTAELEPEWSQGNATVNYTVTMSSLAGDDDIDEVRIIKSPGYTNFICEAKAGWHLIHVDPWFDPEFPGELTELCWYYTTDPSNNIPGGGSEEFEFSATVPPDEGCNFKWKFETRDEESSTYGEWEITYDYTNIDSTEPIVEKTMAGGQTSGPCPPEAGEECWMTQGTTITVCSEDQGDETCQDFTGNANTKSGVAYCDFTLALDGSLEEEWTVEDNDNDDDNDNAGEICTDVTFDEDSLHELTVECYDKAGNVVVDTELFRVDDTPPETTKRFIGPQKIDGLVEWIDGVTEIELNAVDPDPTGQSCNIGVDKTWYINTLVPDEFCENPEQMCQPVCENPYTCEQDSVCHNTWITIDWAQEYCTDNWEAGQYASWEECVESNVHRCCDGEFGNQNCAPGIAMCEIGCLEMPGYDGEIDELWWLYEGPFAKNEESCHILQYFSIDHLGNVEEMQTNCFFVDKTPPEVHKDNGEAIPGSGEPDFITGDNPNGDFHWITTEMPITFTCTDQEPHPSGDEQLCYKVSYDQDPEGYNTDEYCPGPLNAEGYCCVDAGPQAPYEFYFQEESMHDLEYYCVDAVEKKSEVHTQYYKVDDTPPSIAKTMIGTDHLGQCPPTQPGDECYVRDDGVNGVRVEVEDGGPICAVDEVTCQYTLEWEGQIIGEEEFGEEGVDIIFTEDSEHTLTINCEDALGNEMEEDVEVFLVDSLPPETKKAYGDPKKVEPRCESMCESQCVGAGPDCMVECVHANCTHWITSATEVTLAAEDEKVGVETVYWRNELVDDAKCWDVMECNPMHSSQDPGWTEYTEPFTKGEESCHMIEYYSVDRLGNEEIVKAQCVFVDNTPPEGIKEVGEPKIPCEGTERACEGSPETGACEVYDQAQCSFFPGCDWVTEPSTFTCEGTPVTEACNYYGENQCLAVPGCDWVSTGGTCYGEPYCGEYIDQVACETNECMWSGGSDYCAGTPTACEAAAAGWPQDPEGKCLETMGCDWVETPGTGNCEGTPMYDCAEIQSQGYGAGWDDKCTETPGCSWNTQDECDWWVRDPTVAEPTLITLDCEDQGEHPVEQETVCYRVSFDSEETPYLTGEYCSQFGGEMVNEWCCAYVGDDLVQAIVAPGTDPLQVNGLEFENKYELYFMEDSLHDLEFYCMDHLGNTESETDYELFKVDSIPPETEKTYEPEAYISPEGLEFIDTVHQIRLTAEDGGAVCAVGLEDTFYRVSLMRDEACEDPGNCVSAMELWHTEECEGWACLGQANQDFMVTGRADSTNWDLAIGIPDTGDPATTVASLEELPWANGGIPVPFEVSYDAETGLVEYTVDGQTISYTYDAGKAFEYLVLMSKGREGGCDMALLGVKVNGNAVGNVISAGNYEGLVVNVPDTAQINGFKVTGQAAMHWNGECKKQEIPAMHVFAMGTHDNEWKKYEGMFGIEEESCHMIEYYSVDRLGNPEAVKNQCVFVDKRPPEITKDYNRPFFEEEGKEWINSQTEILISAEDPEPHPSGLASLEYRISLVDDMYCEDQVVCQDATGSGDWDPVDGPERIGEESCHLIEIRAEDNVGKESEHKQCVYVDNSAPDPEKTVGEPKTVWDGLDSIYYDLDEFCTEPGKCWKVTLLTPIKLDCVDPLPHPVGHETVCFNVEVDADDETARYCSEMGGAMNEEDGYCCLQGTTDQFFFLEETEHNLKYYCVDALGNEGKIDDEKFKVTGTKFEMELNKKWNLVSVPFVLLDDNVSEVFSDVEENLDSVWTYDAATDEWFVYRPGNPATSDLSTVTPGWGYWVAMLEEDLLTIGGSLFSPATTPPSRELPRGWNLIGYYGADDGEGNAILEYMGPVGAGKVAHCALWSLGSSVLNKGWSTMYTYWEPDNPSQWKPLDRLDYMDPGAGYWALITEESTGLYAPTTSCGLLMDFIFGA